MTAPLEALPDVGADRFGGPFPDALFRPMGVCDLDQVMQVEEGIYPFPWSRGNFSDSLASGYDMSVVEVAGRVVAYAVVMRSPDEFHLLNLSVDRPYQGRGLGRTLLARLIGEARSGGARGLLLEVRPSNLQAVRLYRGMGFKTIGVRKRYYPASGNGREDAVVMILRFET
jgi:ribosomal-protein-alanine N-acetyltransferase